MLKYILLPGPGSRPGRLTFSFYVVANVLRRCRPALFQQARARTVALLRYFYPAVSLLMLDPGAFLCFRPFFLSVGEFGETCNLQLFLLSHRKNKYLGCSI